MWSFQIFFLLQPGPRDSVLQCFIRRNRGNQTYYLYLGINQGYLLIPHCHTHYGLVWFTIVPFSKYAKNISFWACFCLCSFPPFFECYFMTFSTKNSSGFIRIIPASTDDGKFLLAARKCRRPTCTDYIISLNSYYVSKGSSTYVGKLRYTYVVGHFCYLKVESIIILCLSSASQFPLWQIKLSRHQIYNLWCPTSKQWSQSH